MLLAVVAVLVNRIRSFFYHPSGLGSLLGITDACQEQSDC